MQNSELHIKNIIESLALALFNLTSTILAANAEKEPPTDLAF